MGLLNKEQILKAEDLPFRDVEVPEWGGTVRIRTMSAMEGMEFWKILDAAGKAGGGAAEQHLRERTLIMTIVDESGKRVFAEEDLDALRGKYPAVLNRLFAVSAELNGIKTVEKDDPIEKK